MAPPTPNFSEGMIKVDQAISDRDREDDCLSCRLMGSMAFTGLGIYTYASGTSQLKKQQAEILRSGSKFGMGARKFGIFTLSATLVAMGIYRLRN